MKIILTGASAHLAQVLLPQLLALDEVEQVVGIDHKPALLQHPRYLHRQLDIRDPRAVDEMQHGNVLIHMAFIVLRGQLGHRRHDLNYIRSVNIHAAQRIFQTAAEHQYQQAIYLSSASVYGGHPSQALYFREDSPLKPLPGFVYAEHKTDMEHWLDQFENMTRLPLTRFRPHIIIGEHCQPLFNSLLQLPVYPRIASHRPLLQAVHETDVARAICLALTKKRTGIFNLAADYCFNFQEQIKHRRGLSLALPASLMQLMAKLLWQVHGGFDDPAWLSGVDRFLLLDCERAKKELGWQAQVDVEQWLMHGYACPPAPVN